MDKSQCKENTWFGIPREEIDWFPTIDYEKCMGCLACMNKCANNVYAEKDGKPMVAHPKNCVVGCTGCDAICPQKAISHPPKKYLEKLTKHKDFTTGCSCGGNCS